MASTISRERPWWFWPLIAFLIGILIGWLVIGWGVWPVTYKNSLPQDLRAAERQEYILMTAESYAATNDLALAQQRLGAWELDLLREDIQQLQDRLASESPLQATQLQVLANDIGIYNVPVSGTGARPVQQEVQTPIWRTLCTAALWIGLVLAALGLVLYLWRRWRMAREPQDLPPYRAEYPQNEINAAYAPGPPSSQYRGPVMDEWTEGAREALNDLPPTRQAYDPDLRTYEYYEDEDEVIEEQPSSRPAPASSQTAKRAPAAARDVPPPVAVPAGESQPPVPPAAAERASQQVPGQPVSFEPAAMEEALESVGEHRASYQAGESDYDEAFDLTDASGAYMGQCGVSLSDPVGRSHDQAAALQVWLWDTNDPDTKVKVLMSEGAYRDTALRDQLAADHVALPVRAGTPFVLETHKLLLRGVVEQLEYAEQEPAYTIFSQLTTRLQVYRKGG